jgi:hypothetical protein
MLDVLAGRRQCYELQHDVVDHALDRCGDGDYGIVTNKAITNQNTNETNNNDDETTIRPTHFSSKLVALLLDQHIACIAYNYKTYFTADETPHSNHSLLFQFVVQLDQCIPCFTYSYNKKAYVATYQETLQGSACITSYHQTNVGTDSQSGQPSVTSRAISFSLVESFRFEL